MNRPEEEIEPQLVDHVDAVLAVNCWVAFSFTVAEVGETVTENAGSVIDNTNVMKKTRTGKNDIGITKALLGS